MGEKTPSKISGLTFSVSACAFFLVSLIVSAFATGIDVKNPPQWYLYASFLAAPMGFALTGVWYFWYTKKDVKGFVKSQCCHPKYYLIALLLQVGLLSLGELNSLFLRFLERFGYQDSELILPNIQGAGFVGVFITVAVLPALLEEFFFRGIFLGEMQGFSTLAKVLICGTLFALYHQNPAQTVYQFICGVAFALLAVRAGSFLPTVLSHFINNGAIVLLFKLGITEYPTPVYVALLVISGICLVGSVLYLTVFDKQKSENSVEKKGSYKEFFLCALVGIVVFAVSWLTVLLMGF